MKIYVVRHGETSANAEGRFQGWTDNHLNGRGVALAQITGVNMQGIRFDACISSPLFRARETADILLRESGNEEVPIVCDDRIKEIHMGDWEAKSFRTEVDAKMVDLFFRDPFAFPGFPGGETTRQVCDRTQNFLKELIRRDDGKTYLVSTHGFAMRAMLNMLYEDPSDFWHRHVPYNLAVNIIETEAGIARLTAEDRIYYDPADCIDRYVMPEASAR